MSVKKLFCECGRPLEGRTHDQGCPLCAKLLNIFQDDPDMIHRRAKGVPEVWEDLYDVGKLVSAGEASFYTKRNQRVPKTQAWM